jgi:hypothetical protein
MPGPRQYWCGSSLMVPGQVLSSSPSATFTPAGCAAACNADPGCSAFVLRTAPNNCTLLAQPFSAAAAPGGGTLLTAWGLDPAASALGCIATSEPYVCLPPGWDVAGSELAEAVAATSPNPEACRAACDAQAACSHFVFEPLTLRCSLRSGAFSGGAGATAFGTAAGRTCLKTPQHHSMSQPAFGGGGAPLPHGHACYMGVSLGGSLITTVAGSSTSTACARECQALAGCGHWHLQSSGACQLFAVGTALREGYSNPYGPAAGVAVSCLAAVTGTYHCLPPRQAVANTQLSASSGISTRTACAQLCSANSSCSSFQYTAATGSCVLHSTTFVGPSGGNVYASFITAPNSFQVCLRTLSARALFSDTPVPPQTAFGGLPLSTFSPQLDNGVSSTLSCKSPAYISGARLATGPASGTARLSLWGQQSTHTCKRACTHACTHTHIHTASMQQCIPTHVHVCVCMFPSCR